MKINYKSVGFTTLLVLVLALVILLEIGLFISGPPRKYESEIKAQTSKIEAKYKKIKNLQRHVFYYTTYVGEDGNTLVWFNEEGKAIVSRKKSTLDLAKAQQVGTTEFNMKDGQVSLGYGYDNPVYIIEDKDKRIFLDYDTYKEVYFEGKGEVK